MRRVRVVFVSGVLGVALAACNADHDATPPATPATGEQAQTGAPGDAQAEAKVEDEDGAKAGAPQKKRRRGSDLTFHAPGRLASQGESMAVVFTRGDFEILCRAVNRDYVDGTLADTYHDVRVKSAEAARAMRESAAADQPGRSLLASLRTFLGGAAIPAKKMPECQRLADEIDDLE